MHIQLIDTLGRESPVMDMATGMRSILDRWRTGRSFEIRIDRSEERVKDDGPTESLERLRSQAAANPEEYEQLLSVAQQIEKGQRVRKACALLKAEIAQCDEVARVFRLLANYYEYRARDLGLRHQHLLRENGDKHAG
jgi:hypothetical protein